MTFPLRTLESSDASVHANYIMKTTEKIHLTGSVRHPMPGATIIRDAEKDTVIDVTVYGASRLRAENLPDPEQFSLDPPRKRAYLSSDQVNNLLAADPEHLAEITDFLEKSGLKAEKQPNCRRSVTARGPIGKFQEAFNTRLSIW